MTRQEAEGRILNDTCDDDDGNGGGECNNHDVASESSVAYSKKQSVSVRKLSHLKLPSMHSNASLASGRTRG